MNLTLFPPVKSRRTTNEKNKLLLSCAKLKLNYVKDNDEVLVKVREKVVVEAKVKLLFCRVGGWEGGQIKQN